MRFTDAVARMFEKSLALTSTSVGTIRSNWNSRLMWGPIERVSRCELSFSDVRQRNLRCLAFGAILAFGPLLVHSHALALDSSLEKVVHANANDTFALIAYREFGSASMGRMLSEYNSMDYASVLVKGFEVRVPTHADPKKDYAEIVYSKGDATVYPAGSLTHSEKPSDLKTIYTNDRILTGASGFVSLRFASGTIVNVQPNSDVVLRELQCLKNNPMCEVSIDAQAGGVQSNVKKRDSQPAKFRITTPYASAAVRGTMFDFDASSEAILVGVTEGDVDVKSGSGTLNLPTGLGVKAQPGVEPGAPVRLLPAPRFTAIAPRVSIEDTLGWVASEMSSEYLVSMTMQAQGVLEQYRLRTQSANHNIQAVPAGRYFINVRAFDAEGFRGFTNTQELNVVDIQDAVNGPALEVDGKNDDIFVFMQEGAVDLEEFEIQFSLSPEFTDVVSVDVPQDGGAVARFTDEVFYARARGLVSETLVTSFGPVLEVATR